MYIISNFLQV